MFPLLPVFPLLVELSHPAIKNSIDAISTNDEALFRNTFTFMFFTPISFGNFSRVFLYINGGAPSYVPRKFTLARIIMNLSILA
jgi:hypothetical protein